MLLALCERWAVVDVARSNVPRATAIEPPQHKYFIDILLLLLFSLLEFVTHRAVIKFYVSFRFYEKQFHTASPAAAVVVVVVVVVVGCDDATTPLNSALPFKLAGFGHLINRVGG